MRLPKLFEYVFAAVLWTGCASGSDTPGVALNEALGSPSPSVLTHHNDNARTGAQLAETSLSPLRIAQYGIQMKNVNAVDGQILAQPLYVYQQTMNDGAKHNVIVYVTMNNQVSAYDADIETGNPQLWQKSLVDFDSPSVRSYKKGILSTPVIDVSAGVIYLVFRTADRAASESDSNAQTCPVNKPNCVTEVSLANMDAAFWLTALDLKTGNVIRHTQVQGTCQAPGTGVQFSAAHQFQRPALLRDAGSLWLAFGMRPAEWANVYHGWVIRYDELTFSQKGAFCTTPDETNVGEGGGVWGGGAGLSGDGLGNVFFTTGNGQTTSNDVGNSLVKLSATGSQIAMTGRYSPVDPQTGLSPDAWLDKCDVDIGSGGTVLLPGGRVAGGGKTGYMYLLDQAGMSHQQDFVAAVNNTSASLWPLVLPDRSWDDAAHLHGTPVFWSPNSTYGLFYVWGEADALRSYRYDFATDTFQTTPVAVGGDTVTYRIPALPAGFKPSNSNGCFNFAAAECSNTSPCSGGQICDTQHSVCVCPANTVCTPPPSSKVMPGGILSLSANGNTPGTGVLWATIPSNANGTTGPELLAYNAETLGRLWSVFPTTIGHFTPLTVANGQVVAVTAFDKPTGYGQATIYELSPFGRQTTSVWNSGVKNVFSGDFDGDKKWDIGVTGTHADSDHNWYIRYGDGLGGFSASTMYAWGNGVTNVFTGDFDGDGYWDIGVTGTAQESDRNWYIRYGNGTGRTGQFSRSTVYNWGNSATKVITGRFDGDKLWDIAVVDITAGTATIYIRYNLGAGQFGNQSIYVWPAVPGDNFVGGDFDGDGFTDIAVTGSDANPNGGVWHVQRNDQHKSFVPQSHYTWTNGVNNIVAGDFDGDGKADIAVTGTSAIPDSTWYMRYAR